MIQETWSRLLARVALRAPRLSGAHTLALPLRLRLRAAGARRLRVRAGDGVTLRGWFVPPRRTGPSPVGVLFTHGYLEAVELHAGLLLRLARAGHPVVCFDQRAHGGSGGCTTSFGVREASDVATVLAEAREVGLLGEKVVTVGFSMGGVTVLRHAAGEAPPTGVVALAPFSDLATAAETFPAGARLPCMLGRSNGFVPALERAAARDGFAVEEASAEDAVAVIHRPGLLIYPQEDRHLPPDLHAECIARTASGLRVLPVAGAGHVSLLYRDRRRWLRHLLRFLRERAQADVVAVAASVEPPAGSAR